MNSAGDQFRVEPGFADALASAGITSAAAVFTLAAIRVWRKLPDRENCTLDARDAAGLPMRLHIKRYPASQRTVTPADVELAGYRQLVAAGVPAAAIAASGQLVSGGSFVILPDLAGYTSGDRLLERDPAAFPRLLRPTADAAAALHAAGLHHRDLYLGHFMLRDDDGDVRLIDFARVRRLPRWPLRRRWIVKDLAQFWYSSTRFASVTDVDRDAWLARYAEQRRLPATARGRRRQSILRKVNAIARHDAKLNAERPERHVQVPPVL